MSVGMYRWIGVQQSMLGSEKSKRKPPSNMSDTLSSKLLGVEGSLLALGRQGSYQQHSS